MTLLSLTLLSLSLPVLLLMLLLLRHAIALLRILRWLMRRIGSLLLLRRRRARSGSATAVEARIEVSSLHGDGACWWVLRLGLSVGVVLRVMLRVGLLLRSVRRGSTVALSSSARVVRRVSGLLLLRRRRCAEQLGRSSVASECEGGRRTTRRGRGGRHRATELRGRRGHANGRWCWCGRCHR